jgi:hypothetical protein
MAIVIAPVEIIEAHLVADHRVWLRFSDGLGGEVDLGRALRGEVFEPLRDPRTFARFHLELGTIAWPNGADFAPRFLYEQVDASGRAREVLP